MRKYRIALFCLFHLSILTGFSQDPSFKIAKVKYQGGGDWYSNPTSLPNLLEFIRENTNVKVAPLEDVVEVSGTQLYQYPFIYLTGHGNVVFTESEAENLRNYLISGGFLHIDDNYGMDPYIRREMKKVFPDIDFVELPFNHPIYTQHYDFEAGLPKVHEHDGNPPQGFGIIYEGRLVCFYTFECDLGDGWEDRSVHNDPEELRQKALKMGANILLFALNN